MLLPVVNIVFKLHYQHNIKEVVTIAGTSANRFSMVKRMYSFSIKLYVSLRRVNVFNVEVYISDSVNNCTIE